MGDTLAPAYDGCQNFNGIWGGAPNTVPPGKAQNAVNRIFREDLNRTRPLFSKINLTFESVDQQTFFEAANGQGAFFYNAYPSYLSPYLIASLGGRIYTIEIHGQTGIVRQLIDGNSRQFMHAWFVQGFNWLVVQDGIHPPVIWDGTNPATRSNLITNQVPIGSVMEFIHGRFVLATADGKNTIRVGEIAFANTNLNPDDILNFPPELPKYDIATNLGNIEGLYAMPFLDTGTGQNSLVCMCQGGFTSFDFSGPEETFLNPGIQKISLVGTGLQSSHGFAGLNGDVFYRSQEGISSYRNSRIEYDQTWRLTPVSREVNYWIKPDRKDLLEFIPMVSNQNMLFTGCSPLLAQPNNPALGYHRFCRGMVVLDADNMSTAGRLGEPVWHGMWSGIRPWGFARGIIQGQSRCFAFSYDRDGYNRLYEITVAQGDDQFGTDQRKIQSFWLTGELGTVEARTNAFQPKTLTGGMIEFSEVLNQCHVQIDYRPDGSPCWVLVDQADPGCTCPTRTGDCPSPVALPQWGRKYFEQVNPKQCIVGTDIPAWLFHHAQVRVSAVGCITFNRLNIRMNIQTDSQIAACLPPESQCQPINCCPAAEDYAYNIAPAGSNPNVPVVPPDPQTIYTATRIFTATCQFFPSISVTAEGQATSFISQADADQKAQQAAYDNANAQLVCPDCTPTTEADQFIDGGTIDYSAYFASGAYAGSQNRPWRIYDVTLDQFIAYGTVNASGTLQWSTDYPNSAGTFDHTTNIYTDNGGGSTRVALQLGCSFNGENVWPSAGGYGF